MNEPENQNPTLCICGRAVIFFPARTIRLWWIFYETFGAYWGCSGCRVKWPPSFIGGCGCPPVGSDAESR